MAYSDVVSKISTVYELRQLIRAIDGLIEELYKTESEYSQVYRRQIPLNIAAALQDGMPENRDEQANYLDEIRKLLEKVPVVTLRTAFHPSEGFLFELSQKLNELMGTNVVVDIQVSRLLLGGARIEYQGKVADYSVRHQLTQVLESHSDEISSWGTDG